LRTPPALHSFPTRRSSDLVVHGAHHRQLGPHVLPVLCGGERLPLDLVALVALELRERLPPLRGLALRQTERPALGRVVLALRRLDRKSTRLNSSHDQISYA